MFIIHERTNYFLFIAIRAIPLLLLTRTFTEPKHVSSWWTVNFHHYILLLHLLWSRRWPPSSLYHHDEESHYLFFIIRFVQHPLWVNHHHLWSLSVITNIYLLSFYNWLHYNHTIDYSNESINKFILLLWWPYHYCFVAQRELTNRSVKVTHTITIIFHKLLLKQRNIINKLLFT